MYSQTAVMECKEAQHKLRIMNKWVIITLNLTSSTGLEQNAARGLFIVKVTEFYIS